MWNQFKIPLLITLPIIAVQLVLIPFISLFGVIPDLAATVLIFFTLRNGQLFGTVYGFILGLMFDLFSGGLIGSAMFSKTLAGFIAGYFYNENQVDTNISSSMFLLIVFIVALIDSVLYAVLSFSNEQVNFMYLLVKVGALNGIYTALLSTIMFLFKGKEVIQ